MARAPPHATAVALLLLLAGSAGSVVDPAAAPSGKRTEPEPAAPAAADGRADVAGAAVRPLAEALAAGEPRKVIVTFKQAAVDSALEAAASAAAIGSAPGRRAGTSSIAGRAANEPASARAEVRARAFADLKQNVISEGSDAVRRHGVAVDRELPNLPLAVVSVASADALEALRADPSVESVVPVGIKTRALAQSLPLILQPQAATRGYKGAGCSVAIIDGGGDYWSAALGSCTDDLSNAGCRVAFKQDFTGTAFTGDAHGTNVAVTAARVAPGAKIILLDVFAGDTTTDDIILAAVDWVVQNAATYKICSMNLSLGDSSFNTAKCPGSAYEVPFAEARKRGVIAAVASGNDYYGSAISEPACAPSAVSVGAVHDANNGAFDSCDTVTAADRVCCFANVAPFLDMLAPGAIITAGGYTMSGTSMAAPHVAGLMAVLRAARPNAPADNATATEVIAAAKNGGTQVKDWFTQRWFPRANVDGAVTALLGAVDTTPPTGTIRINGGAASTPALNVTLTITGADPSGVASMCVTNDAAATAAACAPWTAFSAAPLPWTLQGPADAPGARTVSLFLRDTPGNTMAAPASAQISYAPDLTPPTATVSINGGAAGTFSLEVQVAVSAQDPSGPATMCVTNAAAATAEGCAPWVPYSSAPFPWTLAGPADGVGPRTVLAFVADSLGNAMTAPASATIEFLVDAEGPSAAVVVADGAPLTRALDVSVRIEATDATGLAQMCATNAAAATAEGCAPWVPYSSAPFPWTLEAGPDGERTVYAFVSDTLGYVSARASDAIAYEADVTPPTATVAINGGAAQTRLLAVSVAVTAEDAASGVAQMCATNDVAASAEGCAPWVAYSAQPFTWQLDAADGEGGPRAVYVFVSDTFANVMAAPASAQIIYAPDRTPPNATVSINGGAGVTTSSLVFLEVAAEDASGLDKMCVTGDAAVTAAGCGPWFNYTTEVVTWKLSTAGGSGDRTVYVFVSDTLGNTMAVPATATIYFSVDSSPPEATVKLANGASTTKTAAISVLVSAFDQSGVDEMCVSNTASSAAACSPYVAYNDAAFSWTLDAAGGDGNRTVRVFLVDGVGNRNEQPYTATVYFDVDDTPPTGSVVINNNNPHTTVTRVSLKISASDDSGLTGLKMCVSEAATCTALVSYASPYAFVLSSGDGVKTVNVWLVDRFGNRMAQPVSDSINLATKGPVGSVLLENGASWTAKRTVAAALAVPNYGASEYCWTTSATLAASACTPWAVTPTSWPAKFDLGTTQGLRTVRVWFRDYYQKTLVSPAASDSVSVDTLAPSNTGAVYAAPYGAKAAVVAWNPSTAVDGGSGRAGFALSYRAGAIPAAGCLASGATKAVPLPPGDLGSVTVTGLVTGQTYYFRVCAYDAVGNRAAGVYAKAVPAVQTAAARAAAVAKAASVAAGKVGA
ncbi:peptidase S8 S53 subtilisin kexin sedolisin [Raphidocelis subcapitata]|uniref:Peptidase S8 S53 subtilisin kexin sedolisin n=1 Tax=Raphidocelis subcapitata TaxID=307507 RepID=A0A2V0PPC4_9CHLO|nr:peptidase S8 S53 subtilisin kexin sedolisin [Raphidocelis subcapitata]|eukprot:GBG00014.1 peptidase S8 S53 subtilisin kexin sedolisin [Raphidocelis subcapitata]